MLLVDGQAAQASTMSPSSRPSLWNFFRDSCFRSPQSSSHWATEVSEVPTGSMHVQSSALRPSLNPDLSDDKTLKNSRWSTLTVKFAEDKFPWEPTEFGDFSKSTHRSSYSVQQRSDLSRDYTQTPVYPDIRALSQLVLFHQHKVYISGRLMRHIERFPDGQQPRRDDGWVYVWAQLCGTSLCIWDMNKCSEAATHMMEVAPTYVNVADSVRFSIFLGV